MTDPINLDLDHDTYDARWLPAGEDEPGVVQIHIGEDVYQDEYADTLKLAQQWVDDFDFDELARELHADDEPDDFDPYDYEGDYLR